MPALLLTGLLLAATVGGSEQLLHVSGHAWEEGAFPPSEKGELLTLVGIVNDIEHPLEWNTVDHSYTVWVRDLVSLGEFVFGTLHVVSYTGGRFTAYEDAAPSNHDYGLNPPNATSPSSFSEGSIYLDGPLIEISLVFNSATESGSLVGTLWLEGGSAFPLLDERCWVFGSNIAAIAPDGYDLQWNGDVYLPVTRGCGPNPIDGSSWGRIKSLYRR